MTGPAEPAATRGAGGARRWLLLSAAALAGSSAARLAGPGAVLSAPFTAAIAVTSAVLLVAGCG